ncbi:hypothetical protein ABZS96_29720 [Streptomyces avermitilis]|uniref:hypothetical protein n=1 Tax=Streptomyces avermitilis TaxID=33903 RepID=UPI0033BD04DA
MTTRQNEAGRPASRSGADEALALLPLQWPEKPAFDWGTSLLANEAAGPNARLRARAWLTIGRWHGNVDIAARVADKLVDNSFKHGKLSAPGRVSLRMAVIRETHELMIEVDDSNPDFPGWTEVANQTGEARGTPTGLWWVAHYRGRLAWGVLSADGETVGKTVQAVLPVT